MLTVLCAVSCDRQPEEQPEPERKYIYDIDCTDFEIITDKVQRGQTAGQILDAFGVNPIVVNEVVDCSKSTFDFRNIRVGNTYTALLSGDSLSRHLEYFIYEKSITDYVAVSFVDDSVSVRSGSKPVTVQRCKRTATISSSLWNSISDAGMPVTLAVDMEDIYGWSVDFFGLTDKDSFTVIYDELSIDSLSIGVGRIWGAVFNHNGKSYYAIPFKQNGSKVDYWDENGNSLRKLLLKAPLKFSRISSRFTGARFHPIYKVYRPHFGVDYAAPSGTPVHAIADGTVTFKGWSRGGGNTLKIRHPRNLESGYMHLRGFARGISSGSHVSQGQLIGYVGSTGASTGPHLDFRLWKGGKPIDPLKAPSEPTEPIKESNRAHFNYIRTQIMAELGDSLKGSPIVQLDSIPATKVQVTDAVAAR